MWLDFCFVMVLVHVQPTPSPWEFGGRHANQIFLASPRVVSCASLPVASLSALADHIFLPGLLQHQREVGQELQWCVRVFMTTAVLVLTAAKEITGLEQDCPTLHY